LVVLLVEEPDFELDDVFDVDFAAAFSAAFATFGSVVEREPGMECEEVEFLVCSIRAVTLTFGLIEAAVAVILPGKHIIQNRGRGNERYIHVEMQPVSSKP
jgi:hypothetical protein